MADETCPSCFGPLRQDLLWCPACQKPKYASWAIQLAEHVLEHLADGETEPLGVLRAMMDRPCYQRHAYQLTLSLIAQQMRLLTRDTTQLARQLAKARAARTMLEVLETGDTKDKIAVMKGIQVLGDVVEHTGEVTTRFVIETHDTPPPTTHE